MPEYFLGLISGTSMDGIDAVLADFEGPVPRVVAAQTTPFEQCLCDELEAVRQNPVQYPAGRLARLDASLGDAFAAAALNLIDQACLQPEAICAIGSHGQTILHDPDHRPPTTLQIGDPHRIAARTGISTVADFRRADLAAGGQGAPLAPLLHEALLASPDENRAVINLGGIANVTILPASGGVSGFDTGPANCLLDHWYRVHHPGRFDRGGQWAVSGNTDQAWLKILLSDGYFSRSAPKSTGIEYFGPQWLQQRLPVWASDRPADVQATLIALTVESIAQALEELPKTHHPKQIIACGGGVHNECLMDSLAERLEPARTSSSIDFGLDPDHVEGLLFGWLACERLACRPVASGPVTGAVRKVLAGVVFQSLPG